MKLGSSDNYTIPWHYNVNDAKNVDLRYTMMQEKLISK